MARVGPAEQAELPGMVGLGGLVALLGVTDSKGLYQTKEEPEEIPEGGLGGPGGFNRALFSLVLMAGAAGAAREQ